LRDRSEFERFGRLVACFVAIAAELGETKRTSS
jgi:hypothetical protein